MYKCMYVCMYISIYTYIHIHIHIHIYNVHIMYTVQVMIYIGQGGAERVSRGPAG